MLSLQESFIIIRGTRDNWWRGRERLQRRGMAWVSGTVMDGIWRGATWKTPFGSWTWRQIHPHLLEPSVSISPTSPAELSEHANICWRCLQLPNSTTQDGKGEGGISVPKSWISFSPLLFLVWTFHFLELFPPSHFYSLSSSVTASCFYWILSFCLLNGDKGIFKFV